jgi:hypothetical protein
MQKSSLLICTALCCGLLLYAGGCATRSSDGVVRRYSFGFTVVAIPKSAPGRPDFAVREVKSYGLSIGKEGATLGYGHLRVASLPPTGALYFEVQTPEDFKRIQNLIENYPNKEICVSQKSPRY